MATSGGKETTTGQSDEDDSSAKQGSLKMATSEQSGREESSARRSRPYQTLSIFMEESFKESFKEYRRRERVGPSNIKISGSSPIKLPSKSSMREKEIKQTYDISKAKNEQIRTDYTSNAANIQKMVTVKGGNVLLQRERQSKGLLNQSQPKDPPSDASKKQLNPALQQNTNIQPDFLFPWSQSLTEMKDDGQIVAKCLINQMGGMFHLENICADIYVPQDTVSHGHSFELKISKSKSSHANAVSDEYRFSPHGTKFDKPILVRFPLLVKQQHNLFSLGVKYTNTDESEADDWCMYPLHFDCSPDDVSFIMWDGFCNLYLNHLCGAQAFFDGETQQTTTAYSMTSHLYVHYSQEQNAAEVLTTFSCKEREEEIACEMMKTYGEPVDEEGFILYTESGNINVELMYNDTKWKLQKHCTQQKKVVDVNRLKICAPVKRPPKVKFFLEQEGVLDNLSGIQVKLYHDDKPPTELTWNPCKTMIKQLQMNNGTINSPDRSLATKKWEQKERVALSLPKIDIDNLLDPLCDILRGNTKHLQQLAQDIGALISDNLEPRGLFQAWFLKEYIGEYNHISLKQEEIWLKLTKQLHHCGYYQEAKMLNWILQKQCLNEQVNTISTNIKSFDVLYDKCKRLDLLDGKTLEALDVVTDDFLKATILLNNVIMEKPLAFDIFTEFLQDTKQTNTLELSLIKSPLDTLHAFILEEVISSNEKYLTDNLNTQMFLEMGKIELIASKNRNKKPTVHSIVEDVKHSLTTVNFSAFLRILNNSGQKESVEKLRDSYLRLDGRSEFCEVQELLLGKTETGFAHLENFNQRYDDFIRTLPEMGTPVCSIHWQQGNGTGFILGSLQNTSTTNPTTHFIVLTCCHLLQKGLKDGIKSSNFPSEARFRFYKDGSGEPEEISTKILKIVLQNEELDYAVLCLDNNDDLFNKFGGSASQSILGKYISDIDWCPPHASILVLVGYPGIEGKQVDPSVQVHSLEHIQTEGLINLPITTRDDKTVFYKCSTLHGASGSPCFDIKKKILYFMHQGGKFLGTNTQPPNKSEYEYGILLYHVVCDIKSKVLSGNGFLTEDGFYSLFPAFKCEENTAMQLQ